MEPESPRWNGSNLTRPGVVHAERGPSRNPSFSRCQLKNLCQTSGVKFLSFLTLCLTALALAYPVHAQQVNGLDYRPSTAIIYNAADPESKTLAEYYATKRGIPTTNLLGLKTSLEETITRAEFQKTIESPLRAAFIERGWWKTGSVPNQGNIAIQTTIRVLTLIRGLPLRITEETIPGAPAPAQGQNNAASVDSELAIAGLLDKPIAGPLQNPYFGRPEPFYLLPITPMFLVGRIDGPDQTTARRLIDDALATEATGLYGKAYIDLALKNEPGYKIGEDARPGTERHSCDGGLPRLYPAGQFSHDRCGLLSRLVCANRRRPVPESQLQIPPRRHRLPYPFLQRHHPPQQQGILVRTASRQRCLRGAGQCLGALSATHHPTR